MIDAFAVDTDNSVSFKIKTKTDFTLEYWTFPQKALKLIKVCVTYPFSACRKTGLLTVK